MCRIDWGASLSLEAPSLGPCADSNPASGLRFTFWYITLPSIPPEDEAQTPRSLLCPHCPKVNPGTRTYVQVAWKQKLGLDSVRPGEEKPYDQLGSESTGNPLRKYAEWATEENRRTRPLSTGPSLPFPGFICVTPPRPSCFQERPRVLQAWVDRCLDGWAVSHSCYGMGITDVQGVVPLYHSDLIMVHVKSTLSLGLKGVATHGIWKGEGETNQDFWPSVSRPAVISTWDLKLVLSCDRGSPSSFSDTDVWFPRCTAGLPSDVFNWHIWEGGCFWLLVSRQKDAVNIHSAQDMLHKKDLPGPKWQWCQGWESYPSRNDSSLGTWISDPA